MSHTHVQQHALIDTALQQVIFNFSLTFTFNSSTKTPFLFSNQTKKPRAWRIEKFCFCFQFFKKSRL